MENTKVSDAGLAQFKDCKGLTDLDLDGAQVGDAGLAHLKDCKNLKDLDLQRHGGERRRPGVLQGLQEPDAPRSGRHAGHRRRPCVLQGLQEPGRALVLQPGRRG